MFYERGPGLLVHPLWQAANTYFVSLRLEQAPRPDYLRYSFSFWEENGASGALATRSVEAVRRESLPESVLAEAPPKPAAQASYHRVVKGDTLWTLSRRYGLSLTALVALNPQIKNPNLIRVGEEVRVG